MAELVLVAIQVLSGLNQLHKPSMGAVPVLSKRDDPGEKNICTFVPLCLRHLWDSHISNICPQHLHSGVHSPGVRQQTNINIFKLSHVFPQGVHPHLQPTLSRLPPTELSEELLPISGGPGHGTQEAAGASGWLHLML